MLFSRYAIRSNELRYYCQNYAVPAVWFRRKSARSRFSRVQFLDVLMPLRLRRICPKLALAFLSVWPSRQEYMVGIRIAFFEAQFPAVDASVYASPGTSRHPAQDSRSGRFATPFLWDFFIPLLHAGLSRRLHFPCGRGSVTARFLRRERERDR